MSYDLVMPGGSVARSSRRAPARHLFVDNGFIAVGISAHGPSYRY
jgi:hypothetical protein